MLLSLCPWYNVYILEIETNKLVSAFGKRTCVRVYGRKFGLAPDPAHLHTQLLIPVQCPLSLPRALSEPQRRHFLYSDCKMGHVSKCISTCGLMSLLTPFQPRSALKLMLFSTFEKYLPTPVSWLPSFLRRITIL